MRTPFQQVILVVLLYRLLGKVLGRLGVVVVISLLLVSFVKVVSLLFGV